jgi:hypothetical protein
MGFLDTLFGGGKQLPALDPSSPTAARLERNRAKLEEFATRVKDKLEIVPGERGTYVFVGKPPDAFGIVWFHDGEESNFKILMKERGLSAQTVQLLSDQLRDAYSRNRAEPRYAWTLAGRDVKVTPSAALEQQVAAIIRGVTG